MPALAESYKIKGPEWVASTALAGPLLPADIPAQSAGCVVVGYHVLADGSVDRAMVMGGAYTANIAQAQQLGFERDVLERMKQWRFKSDTPSETPWTGFRTETVGFVPMPGAGGARVVTGATAQSKSLRGLCGVPDLAAWGTKNAISVDEARVRNHGKPIVSQADTDIGYWIRIGELRGAPYPASAFQAQAGGCVAMDFVIREDGVPDTIQVVWSKFVGSPTGGIKRALQHAAMDAVSQWRYAPHPENPERAPALQRTYTGFSLPGHQEVKCAPSDVEAAMAGMSQK